MQGQSKNILRQLNAPRRDIQCIANRESVNRQPNFLYMERSKLDILILTSFRQIEFKNGRTLLDIH